MEAAETLRRTTYEGLWVLADLSGGEVRAVTLELLAQGRRIADTRKTTLSVVLLGDSIETAVEELSHYGADAVIYVNDPRLSHFREEVLSDAVVQLIDKYKPEILLGSATGQGRSLLPRISAACETGLTADCTSLDVDPETGLLLQTRPAFGGNLFATITTEHHRPQTATVRPHVFERAARTEQARSTIVEEHVAIEDRSDILKSILKSQVYGTGAGSFAGSHIIITGGRGVRGQEGFELLKEFAELTGAAVGATRAAVDLGWIPYEHQIGQTGLTVRSKIYVACGVSGQVQHLVGMKNCKCIVSINIDESAPIMQLSDIAVVGDLFQVIPEMIAFVKREQGLSS